MKQQLKSLVPKFRDYVTEWLKQANSRGFQVLVYNGYRSPDQQHALYAQGRDRLEVVNKLRAAAGMSPLSAQENARVVTRAKPGWSWHNYGLAIDFVPITLDRKADWLYNPLDQKDIYDEVVELAKSVIPDVIWGGDWTGFKDYGHLEWHPGLTLTEARRVTSNGSDLTGIIKFYGSRR